MPQKKIRETTDVSEWAEYKLRVDPQIVRELVRLAKSRGLYWTDIATLLLTDGLKAADLWPPRPDKGDDDSVR